MEDKKYDAATCEQHCPAGRIYNGLCMVNKIMHIIVFIALTFVLFDIHGMLKAQREYANAVTAAMNANAGAQAGGAQSAGMMQRQ